jgi:hypothetical protein
LVGCWYTNKLDRDESNRWNLPIDFFSTKVVVVHRYHLLLRLHIHTAFGGLIMTVIPNGTSYTQSGVNVAHRISTSPSSGGMIEYSSSAPFPPSSSKHAQNGEEDEPIPYHLYDGLPSHMMEKGPNGIVPDYLRLILMCTSRIPPNAHTSLTISSQGLFGTTEATGDPLDIGDEPFETAGL